MSEYPRDEKLEEIKAKIEELKRRAATEPNFGRQKTRTSKQSMTPEEKAEFKEWRKKYRAEQKRKGVTDGETTV